MQLLVRGVHIQVTDALREYCEIHMRRALDRVLGQEPAVQVEVHLVDTNESKGGMDLEARVTVHVPGHPALQVTERSDEIHRAIAAASDRIERAAKKYLDRKHDHSGPSLADLPTDGS
ncbi:MAG TPA: ribosome-associated translation inhibitor RaiA [Myxococcaceae bacterium]|nr:ribosome-associated translation inhibitor RaiA [Myxococcaceae bacterium]